MRVVVVLLVALLAVGACSGGKQAAPTSTRSDAAPWAPAPEVAPELASRVSGRYALPASQAASAPADPAVVAMVLVTEVGAMVGVEVGALAPSSDVARDVAALGRAPLVLADTATSAPRVLETIARLPATTIAVDVGGVAAPHAVRFRRGDLGLAGHLFDPAGAAGPAGEPVKGRAVVLELRDGGCAVWGVPDEGATDRVMFPLAWVAWRGNDSAPLAAVLPRGVPTAFFATGGTYADLVTALDALAAAGAGEALLGPLAIPMGLDARESTAATGALTGDEVRAALDAAKLAEGCVESRTGLDAVVFLTLAIDGGGKLIMRRALALDPALATCVAIRLDTVLFPARAGATKVTALRLAL